MSDLIRLETPFWLTYNLEDGEQPEPGWIPMRPRFNRNGLYAMRHYRRVWMEHNGYAWRNDAFWYFVQAQVSANLLPRFTQQEIAAFRMVWRFLPDKTRRLVEAALERDRVERALLQN